MSEIPSVYQIQELDKKFQRFAVSSSFNINSSLSTPLHQTNQETRRKATIKDPKDADILESNSFSKIIKPQNRQNQSQSYDLIRLTPALVFKLFSFAKSSNTETPTFYAFLFGEVSQASENSPRVLVLDRADFGTNKFGLLIPIFSANESFLFIPAFISTKDSNFSLKNTNHVAVSNFILNFVYSSSSSSKAQLLFADYQNFNIEPFTTPQFRIENAISFLKNNGFSNTAEFGPLLKINANLLKLDTASNIFDSDGIWMFESCSIKNYLFSVVSQISEMKDPLLLGLSSKWNLLREVDVEKGLQNFDYKSLGFSPFARHQFKGIIFSISETPQGPESPIQNESPSIESFGIDFKNKKNLPFTLEKKSQESKVLRPGFTNQWVMEHCNSIPNRNLHFFNKSDKSKEYLVDSKMKGIYEFAFKPELENPKSFGSLLNSDNSIIESMPSPQNPFTSSAFSEITKQLDTSYVTPTYIKGRHIYVDSSTEDSRALLRKNNKRFSNAGESLQNYLKQRKYEASSKKSSNRISKKKKSPVFVKRKYFLNEDDFKKRNWGNILDSLVSIEPKNALFRSNRTAVGSKKTKTEAFDIYFPFEDQNKKDDRLDNTKDEYVVASTKNSNVNIMDFKLNRNSSKSQHSLISDTSSKYSSKSVSSLVEKISKLDGKSPLDTSINTSTGKDSKIPILSKKLVNLFHNESVPSISNSSKNNNKLTPLTLKYIKLLKDEQQNSS
ncbi:hypothetical protein BB560_007193 [Smittium megazygosporum]|uniref:Uncharacterized protein n=1 Tax=Smittium megazygosporum TaxID=133381 RepID=A0A2T9XY23_9FUNG|nr:hypothetical protein BB560_007193 [Smittium megazygosporum]